MSKNWILGHSCLKLYHPFRILYMYVYIITYFSVYWFSYGQAPDASPYNSFTISSFTYSSTVLRPYNWRYIRVDLPPWFASLSISLESNVNTDLKSIQGQTQSTLPMICFREGSPPIPDVYNTSLTGLDLGGFVNSSFGGVRNLQIVGQCYPMQKNVSLRITNEQISSGVWYIGLFNGIGPHRTQSKMINRGLTYSFNGNVSVEGCTTSTLLGQFCNQTIDLLSCIQSYNSIENVISCKNSDKTICHNNIESKFYTLDIVGIAEKIIITASNVTSNSDILSLTCYARNGAIPSKLSHDYSGIINEKSQMIIDAPRLGRWYFMIEVANKTENFHNTSLNICYSLELKVLQCPVDKAGMNCTWNKYALQTILRQNPSGPFESYFLPISEKVTPDSANFPIEPLISNVSLQKSDEIPWTFFEIDIPSEASGGNIHIRIESDTKINYEIYVKYGGLPTISNWDYFYTNSTSNSNGSMFFKLYESSEKMISFYLLYVRGGTWNIGLRHLNYKGGLTEITEMTEMSISLVRCPEKCSDHGTCQSGVDTSGLAVYSYCTCDRNHGGFDCSVQLVTRRGHMWQSFFLIASNAAALLPSCWALRHKAFPELIIFTASGISSGVYHACDVGTWCALSYRVLQFMDFWLSFIAIISTFIHLTTMDDFSKRTIHTFVAIITALLAETNATRGSNIYFVTSIGVLILLMGWLIAFCTHRRSFAYQSIFNLNLLDTWESTKLWIINLLKKLKNYFRWGFLIAGFVTLSMAAISWNLETSESYWLWHSMWHVTIYTASFFFFNSKANAGNSEDGIPPLQANYELTRQNSFTNGEQRVQI